MIHDGPARPDPRVPPDPAGEPVDWVDDDDRVISVVTRSEMRRRRLLHRAVYVAVCDGDGAVVVHQRAGWKDLWPSAWDVCFGGVLRAGESWVAGARRELAEEAGIATDAFLPLGAPFRYEDDEVALLGRLYLVRTDDVPHPADGEVVATDRVPLDRLAAWAAGRVLCPDSRAHVLPRLSTLPG